MQEEISILIDFPSGCRRVDLASHFCVSGRILPRGPLPDDASFRVCLYDAAGKLLRHITSDRKNDMRQFLYHPQLTGYPEELDPGREKLKAFGFPEVLVKDPADPYASMRDSTIKCFFTDDAFKAIIISGTDKAHGMLLDDGIGFTDENGQPYNALPRGKYRLEAVLSAQGRILARADTVITIDPAEDTLICRFNPAAHKRNMWLWSVENGFYMQYDPLPGYLDPYLGKWYYHMGLLPMYRASDIAQYASSRVNMFVYLIDPESTSYSTELAWLQAHGAVGDPDRFRAYCYDIGEAVIGEGTASEMRGRIIPFARDEAVHICRIDTVKGRAEDNVYDLSGKDLLASSPASGTVEIRAGSRFAVMSVVKPVQLDPAAFSLRPDNTYEIRRYIHSLKYTFECRGEKETYMRPTGLSRIDTNGANIGSSIFEGRHIFQALSKWHGETVAITLQSILNDGSEIGLPSRTYMQIAL